MQKSFHYACVFFYLMSITAYATQIEVCGDVNGVWSTDTVLVTCEIRVPPYDTLIIEPGVLVLFHAHYKFIVDTGAVLKAIGSETDSVTFDELFPGNGWHGIRFVNSSDSSHNSRPCSGFRGKFPWRRNLYGGIQSNH
jgi:hypothetical protein